MKLKSAAITAVGGYVPEYRLTNKELEGIVDTSDEWIRSRTGIEERRILRDHNLAASDVALEAVKDLLKKRGIKPDEIDMLIVGTVTGDYIFPDTANIVLDKLGGKNAFGYDINAACSGFIYSLTTGAQFIRTGMYKKVVVVGVDIMSRIIDYEDRSTCIIFGDGAGAVLLEPTESENSFIDASLYADGSGREFLHMKSGGSKSPPSKETVERKEHYVFQKGAPVFKAAIQGMVESIKDVLHRNHIGVSDVDWIVPHQANLRIINAVADGLSFPMDKVMVNIHKYGNTTAGTIPLCLWDYESQLKQGDLLVLTAFGGGFTWGAVVLRWAI